MPFTVNPRLVRGLDYYNLTVFEWITDALGAQGTICGGGRYDPLVERIGGRPSPSCGFAIGVERVIELLKEAGSVEDAAAADVYVVHQGGATAAQAFVVAERLRDAGLDAAVSRRRRQPQVADEEGRCQRRGVRRHRRRDGAGPGFGGAEGAARPGSGPAGGGEQRIVPLDRLADELVDALTRTEQQ